MIAESAQHLGRIVDSLVCPKGCEGHVTKEQRFALVKRQ